MTEEKKPRPNIAITPVESSSNVAGWGYDQATATLAVKFKSGQTYHYAGVAGTLVEGLRKAKSVGGFIGAFIVKGGFAHTKVE